MAHWTGATSEAWYLPALECHSVQPATPAGGKATTRPHLCHAVDLHTLTMMYHDAPGCSSIRGDWPTALPGLQAAAIWGLTSRATTHMYVTRWHETGLV